MNDVMSQILSASFIYIVIRAGTPLVYASMSAYIANLAGISNIAVDGIMNFGALFGVYFSAITGSAWLGLIGAILVGMLCGGVLAFFALKMKANPIMVGIALNLFSADFAIYLLLIWTGTKGTSGKLASKVLPRINIPLLQDIPILGEIFSGHLFLTYLCVALMILLYIMVYKTPFGLRMKSCGLDAHAAESVGIKVNLMRTIAALMSGAFAAMGGAYLSMGYLSIYSNNMTASRGWIGIAAAAVGGKNLGIVFLMTGVFAIAQGIVNILLLGSLPAELINTIPYISVLVGLVIMSYNSMRKARQQMV